MGALVSSAAASPPIGDPFDPTFPVAQHLCTVQGGEFEFFGPGAFYQCFKSSGFSKGQLNAGRGVCNAYRGVFAVDAFDSPGYICVEGGA
jgi:hypothetical protein